MLLRLLLVLFIGLFYVSPGLANTPRLKPAPPNSSDHLGDLEFRNFQKAMQEIDNQNWSAAKGYRSAVHNQSAAILIDWHLALGNPRETYFELANTLQATKDWPRQVRIQVLAEEKISNSGMNNASIAKWFANNPARSGAGKIAHAEALFALGEETEAIALLKDGWRNHSLPKKLRTKTLRVHGSRFTRDDHIARVDMLLWKHYATEAAEILSKSGSDFRALSIARIRLMRRTRSVDSAIKRVPAKYKTHAGLLYERALWRRKSGKTSQALPLVQKLPETGATHDATRRLWTEKKIHLRRAIKNRRYQIAYDLAKAHGHETGANFADGEWTAGWIALRFLNRPAHAASHFQNLTSVVKTPVSRARAHYWLALAQQKQGQQAEASTSFRQASKWNFTYYGQLARQKLGPDTIIMGADPEPSAADLARFTAHPQVQAMKLLAERSDWRNYRTFSYHLDDLLPGAVDHVMLSRLSQKYGQPGVGLRAAKAALHRDELLPESQWPLIDVPSSVNLPEPAFALALSRQESELYPKAISRVGARGLMQMMPATAKRTARNLRRTYRKSWLTDDPEYNMELGTAHLQELLDKYDGSYILAAAAYNAGAHRVNSWLDDYGDPRNNTDPVDWVESIPYSETRNYVQRVMENIQVYRSRITGQAAQIQLYEDLRRGR